DPCASWTFPIPPTTNVTQQLFTNIRIFAHRNTLHITGIQDSKITNIQLFDVQGKLHFSCESTQCLLTQRFNSGVYFVSVTHTQGITSQKIVF
ncbi:MAG: T9SS type A sorting domain-containing protein, partial [Bacteroidales bacterium]|nr:T9SS type A sorting domain-containing protein [Bacteroidales bacterium]